MDAGLLLLCGNRHLAGNSLPARRHSLSPPMFDSETAKPLADFTPFVSVFAPCRGLEDGLQENLTALFQQDYPAYEIVFVSDRADDPSLALIRKLSEDRERSRRRVLTKIVIAGSATDSGQKVHNLRVAVPECDLRQRSIRVCRYGCETTSQLVAFAGCATRR